MFFNGRHVPERIVAWNLTSREVSVHKVKAQEGLYI